MFPFSYGFPMVFDMSWFTYEFFLLIFQKTPEIFLRPPSAHVHRHLCPARTTDPRCGPANPPAPATARHKAVQTCWFFGQPKWWFWSTENDDYILITCDYIYTYIYVFMIMYVYDDIWWWWCNSDVTDVGAGLSWVLSRFTRPTVDLCGRYIHCWWDSQLPPRYGSGCIFGCDWKMRGLFESENMRIRMTCGLYSSATGQNSQHLACLKFSTQSHLFPGRLGLRGYINRKHVLHGPLPPLPNSNHKRKHNTTTSTFLSLESSPVCGRAGCQTEICWQSLCQLGGHFQLCSPHFYDVVVVDSYCFRWIIANHSTKFDDQFSIHRMGLEGLISMTLLILSFSNSHVLSWKVCPAAETYHVGGSSTSSQLPKISSTLVTHAAFSKVTFLGFSGKSPPQGMGISCQFQVMGSILGSRPTRWLINNPSAWRPRRK